MLINNCILIPNDLRGDFHSSNAKSYRRGGGEGEMVDKSFMLRIRFHLDYEFLTPFCSLVMDIVLEFQSEIWTTYLDCLLAFDKSPISVCSIHVAQSLAPLFVWQEGTRPLDPSPSFGLSIFNTPRYLQYLPVDYPR